MSGIGMVILVGVAVNNAIVLVNTSNLRMSEGLAPLDAILMASKDRFRPILMTALTTIVGLLPLALGWGDSAALRAPLAISVIGGLLSSTLLVLLVLPSMVLSFKRTSKK
jgi:HAE1 family hydrophobic/amphiphilic exporter-1